MKRATREWAKYQRDCGKHPSLGKDILDSDAQIRDLKARLAACRLVIKRQVELKHVNPRANWLTDLRVKNWRKPS